MRRRRATLLLALLPVCAPLRAHSAPRFPATDYAGILDRRTVTATTYSGVPLAELSAAPRAATLPLWCSL